MKNLIKDPFNYKFLTFPPPKKNIGKFSYLKSEII